MDRGSWRATVCGIAKELNTTKQAHVHKNSEPWFLHLYNGRNLIVTTARGQFKDFLNGQVDGTSLGGPAAKTLCSQCRGPRFDLW